MTALLATITYQVPVDLVEAVGRAVNEVISEKDGSAIAAVKGKTRLANATGVDPLPSSPSPDLSLVQATAAAEATPPASAATNPVANVGEEAISAIAAASSDPASREVDGADRQQPVISGFTGEDDERNVEASGGAALVITNLAGRNSDSSDSALLTAPAIETPAIAARQAGISQTEDQTPEDRAAISSKDGCMNPHDCRIKFKTTALCWKCNAARPKAGAAA